MPTWAAKIPRFVIAYGTGTGCWPKMGFCSCPPWFMTLSVVRVSAICEAASAPVMLQNTRLSKREYRCGDARERTQPGGSQPSAQAYQADSPRPPAPGHRPQPEPAGLAISQHTFIFRFNE